MSNILSYALQKHLRKGKLTTVLRSKDKVYLQLLLRGYKLHNMQMMINPCGGLHFGMTKCLKSTILFLFKLSALQSKLFIFQALLIHDITSSDYNAQLVALGIVLRGGRGRTCQAHDQNNNIRERCLLLKNISKEKRGHFLSLYQLFHQNFYSTLAVAASGSPVEVRLLQQPAPARSKSEHVFPIHTHAHTQIHVYNAQAQTVTDQHGQKTQHSSK